MGPLENTKILCLFLRKQTEKYLLNVCRTGEETWKCGFSNMEFKRRHRPETDWFYRAADRLILQPNICLDKSWFIEEVFLYRYE